MTTTKELLTAHIKSNAAMFESIEKDIVRLKEQGGNEELLKELVSTSERISNDITVALKALNEIR